MEYLFIYLLQLAQLREDFGFIFVFTIIVSAIVYLVLYFEKYKEEEEEKLQKACKKAVVVSAILLLLTGLLPSERTLLLSGGVYFGKASIETLKNSEKMKKVSELIDLQLDRFIEEAKKGVK